MSGVGLVGLVGRGARALKVSQECKAFTEKNFSLMKQIEERRNVRRKEEIDLIVW